MDQLIGKKLDGRYLLQELVGVGGMANVYKAADLKNNSTVAVKIPRWTPSWCGGLKMNPRRSAFWIIPPS